MDKIYNSRRWREARQRALDRDGWRCVACGKSARLEVDHITPLEKFGDPYSQSNLQSLCRSCHFKKTARENTRRRSSGEVTEWLEYRDMLEFQSIKRS